MDVKHPAPGQHGVFLSQQQHAHSMDRVAHVELRGLRFEYAMAEAVSAQNVTNVTIDNCTISNSGTDGILRASRLFNCAVSPNVLTP